MFDVGDRIIGLELPDTFYKLAELLEQDQFELLLSKNRIKDMHREQDISLVYLMNDAVESFLVFHNATITGQYKSEYEGGLLAVLDKKEEEYVLVFPKDKTMPFRAVWNLDPVLKGIALLRGSKR